MRASNVRMITTSAVAALALLAGCTTADPGKDSNDTAKAKKITVWTLEDVEDRVTKTKAIMSAFTKKSGVDVELVAIAEDQFDQVVTSAAANGKLPDVIAALPLSSVQSLAVNDLLDKKTPGEIVEALGTDTFSEAALKLTRDGDTQLSVPSDAWSQLLYYRTDLFKQAGLAPPDTFEAITAAAKKLTTGGTAGIALSTTPGDGFTQQSFEYFALGNKCELVDDSGKVTLASKQCVESFAFYNDLVKNASVKGNQDVDTTRANYFAGKTAMVVWSTFLLDELAGLRDDALPTCPQCKTDKAFLAKNTGVVGPVRGPSGEPRQYGEIVSWTITRDANPPASKEFVEYMMGTAYVDWLGIAPEGKVPVRKGTADESDKFLKSWAGLKAGVDRKAPLADFYSSETLDSIVKGPESFARWGFPQGQGELVGAMAGQLPVPKAIAEMVSGDREPAAAAKQAQAAVSEIAESLK